MKPLPWPLVLATAICSLFFLCVGLLVGYEALRLGPFASAERVADFHFGSEAMVGHGGWAYRSRGNYVLSCVGDCVGASFISACGILGLRRREPTLCAASLVGGLGALGLLL